MTTYTDLIRRMDNPRYVGKMDKPIKRVNKVYDLFIDGSFIKTEYHKDNDQLASARLMDYAKRLRLVKVLNNYLEIAIE